MDVEKYLNEGAKTNKLMYDDDEKELLDYVLQYAIDNQNKMGGITPDMAKKIQKIIDRM